MSALEVGQAIAPMMKALRRPRKAVARMEPERVALAAQCGAASRLLPGFRTRASKPREHSIPATIEIIAADLDFRLAFHARFRPEKDMDADLVPEPDAGKLQGSSIIAAIKASGVEFILSVPDIVTSGGLLRPIARDPELRLIRVCKEDECIGIACGLAYCDRRALTLIQHTGFLDSINAIRGVGVEFNQPICMMVGLLQHDPRTACASSSRSSMPWASPTT
jgi:hypothetical protein